MAVYRRPQTVRHYGRTSAALAFAALLTACSGGANDPPNNGRICAAYATQGSHGEVVASGVVRHVLGTRRGPSGEHEGFLLQLDGDCDLLLRVETNVDLTGPVPLHDGERVIVKGEYEFDPMGGVVHWTHRDPRGHHPDGYVKADDGKVYQ
ncbi:MAG: DUF3465 domain-containing protein [Candidatus Eremiobacteraeota bacterium]|nr:DUF3465 domain-containing protein [Candidatus Eremiobacteraeota bacterium]